MIILNKSEIEACIDYTLAARAVEAAYCAASQSNINLPPVGYIRLAEHDGDCHIKYGHIAGDENFVIKIATGFPGNEALGISNGSGAVVVMSARTGEVKAILHDEMLLTDIRTGLGGAIASKALARPNSKNILIVGTGIQARRQVEAHIALLGNNLEFKIWGRSPEKAIKAANEIADIANISPADDLERACGKADIIVTITAATNPIIKRSWVKAGTHISAVGADAPGKQELDTELVATADGLYCDLLSQCIDHGELAIPAAAKAIAPDQVIELGTLLLNPEKGRQSENDITICDLTGIAAQDIAMANVVLAAYRKQSRKT